MTVLVPPPHWWCVGDTIPNRPHIVHSGPSPCPAIAWRFARLEFADGLYGRHRDMTPGIVIYTRLSLLNHNLFHQRLALRLAGRPQHDRACAPEQQFRRGTISSRWPRKGRMKA